MPLGSNKRGGRESDFSVKEEPIERRNLENFQTFNSSPMIRTSDSKISTKQNDIPELDERDDDKDQKLLVIGFDNAPVGKRPKFSKRTPRTSDIGSGTE